MSTIIEAPCRAVLWLVSLSSPFRGGLLGVYRCCAHSTGHFDDGVGDSTRQQRWELRALHLSSGRPHIHRFSGARFAASVAYVDGGDKASLPCYRFPRLTPLGPNPALVRLHRCSGLGLRDYGSPGIKKSPKNHHHQDCRLARGPWYLGCCCSGHKQPAVLIGPSLRDVTLGP